MEARELRELRAHVGSLGRSLAQHAAKKHRGGKGSVERAQRRGTLEQRRQAAHAAVAGLERESEEQKQQLAASMASNCEADELVQRLEEEHSLAVEENLRARRALGEHASLEFYRRTKFQERAEADGALAQAMRECEAETARLEEQVAESSARHRAELLELRSDVEALQVLLTEKRSEAEAALSQQAKESQRALQEVESQVTSETRQLEEQRHAKAMLLRKQAEDSRRNLAESSKGTQKHLNALLDEVRTAYRTRVQMEEAKCSTAMEAQLRSVEDAKRERQEWERRAELTRENFRGHVIKSGSYVRSLEPEKRRELQNLWMQS
jgi:hypothetical protein